VKEAAAKQLHNDTTLLPHASETYQVMQSADAMPKIVQATIDPLGVHVGDTQHLSIILNDPDSIVSVEAQIQTDHGTTTLPLKLVGPAQVSEILPQKYYVDSQNRLALMSDRANVAKSGNQNVALAATGGDVKYTGSWLVHDTHDTFYKTIFVAKDSAGHTSSVVLAWSDACGIATTGGNVTLSAVCAESSLDGVEGGNLIMATSGTMTISSTTFVINPGYSIRFFGGVISIGTTAQIVTNKYICTLDADGDSYWTGGGVTDTTSTCADYAGYVDRASEISGNDCNDTATGYYVHPGQTGYFSSSTLTDLGANTYDYNCDGTISYELTTSTIISEPTCYQYSCTSYCAGGGVTCSRGVIATSTADYTPACGSGLTIVAGCSMGSQAHTCCQINGLDKTGVLCQSTYQNAPQGCR
jgi:hypothetical protein